jgi:hypothetical protein
MLMNIAVGTLASATALASSSAVASAMPAAPDPIFAAIEIDRKLNAEFMRLSNSEDALRESGIEPVHGMSGLRPMEKTPPLAEPAIALSGPDPIFAAVDAHRSAYAAVDDVLQQQSLLEDGIPADKREWWWGATICIPRPTAKMIQGGWPCRSN